MEKKSCLIKGRLKARIETRINKRQQQAANTKAAFIEAATDCFAENGYKGTSIRMINKKAGLADGLMYHYFPGGKKEIFEEIVKTLFEELMAYFDKESSKIRKAECTISEMLEEAFKSFVTEMKKHIKVIKLIYREEAVRDFISMEDIEAFLKSGLSWIKDYLENRIDKGEIRRMDCEAACLSISAIMVSHLTYMVLDINRKGIANKECRKQLAKYYQELWAV